MYKKFIFFLLSAVILNSCNESSTNELFTHQGLRIYSYPPTGWTYIDSSEIQHGYRSIVTDFTNDTTGSVKIEIDLPDTLVPLVQANGGLFKVFILPDTLTREKQFKENDLTPEMKRFLGSETSYNHHASIVLNPGETFKLRLGFLFTNIDGVVRAEVVSKWHRSSFKIPGEDNLIWNTDPANQISLKSGVMVNASAYQYLDCGKIIFMK